MASWLPETLYETVGQGPAPSKDYYQLLVTRSQASASRGLPFPLPPYLARLGPKTRAALGRERPWPAGSAQSLAGSRDFPRHLGPEARVSLLSPLLVGLRRAFGVFPQSRPLPSRRSGCVPAAFARAPRKTGVLGLRAASPQRGKEGKKDSAKCPEEEPGEGRKRGRDGLFFPG